MVLYRVLHALDAGFPVAVLFIYIAAFLMAFAFMFMFPQVTLLLLFMGLGGMVLAVLIKQSLGLMLRLAARQALARNLCPRCRRLNEDRLQRDPWQCPHCGAAFACTGIEITPDPHQVT
jgi:hypothetical protein